MAMEKTPTYSEIKFSQYHFVYYKSHISNPEIKLIPSRREWNKVVLS